MGAIETFKNNWKHSAEPQNKVDQNIYFSIRREKGNSETVWFKQCAGFIPHTHKRRFRYGPSVSQNIKREIKLQVCTYGFKSIIYDV